MEIKQLVEEVEKKENVTPYRIAKDLGISPSNVYAWKKGNQGISSEHLLELLRRAGRLAAAVFVGLFVGVLLQQNVMQAVDLAALPFLGITSETLCIMLNCIFAIIITMRAIFPRKINTLIPSPSI